MKRLWIALSLCFSLMFLSLAADAQAVGSISGHVTDVTGAIIPGSSVTVTNQGTNAERTVTADTSGFFAITLLPIGTYTIQVTSPGF